MVKVKCDYCGKEFEKHKSAIKRTKNNFCSSDCFYNSRKNNKYIINNDYVIIETYSKKYGIKQILIDLEDIEKVKKYHWYSRIDTANNNFYALAHGEKDKTILLHRLIMKCPNNKVIDHINHNGLDNRKCNLNICEHFENMQNVKSKGYFKHNKINKWYAYITVMYKRKYFGPFETEEEAKKSRLEAEEKYFKYKSEIKC